jgi:hypothetical protein
MGLIAKQVQQSMVIIPPTPCIKEFTIYMDFLREILVPRGADLSTADKQIATPASKCIYEVDHSRVLV